MAREMGDEDARKYMDEIAQERTQEMAEASEINMFTVDPNGYKAHWRIVKGTTGEELNALIKNQQVLSDWLKGHNYRPDDFGRGQSVAAAPVVTVNPANASPPAAAVWVQNPDGTKSCSVHGPAAFQAPGVSRTTGKPYTGFWKCSVNGCRPNGAN